MTEHREPWSEYHRVGEYYVIALTYGRGRIVRDEMPGGW